MQDAIPTRCSTTKNTENHNCNHVDIERSLFVMSVAIVYGDHEERKLSSQL